MVFEGDKSTDFLQNRLIKCGDNTLNLDRPQVMGIINLTPDSFYAGSRCSSTGEVIALAGKMIGHGADIIDIGAVSSRPGAHLAPEQEELSRLLPVLHALVKHFPGTIFSVDTFRAAVATAASEAGAGIINDISAGALDADLIPAVAKTGLPYILMHMQGNPLDMQQSPHYENVVDDVVQFFERHILQLQSSGIQNIILDPGFGFGKTYSHNYQLLDNLTVFKKFRLPLLVGISRKSMIYKPLQITPDEALNGTTALHMAALLNGANILRVHDVQQAVEVVRLFEMLRKPAQIQ